MKRHDQGSNCGARGRAEVAIFISRSESALEMEYGREVEDKSRKAAKKTLTATNQKAVPRSWRVDIATNVQAHRDRFDALLLKLLEHVVKQKSHRSSNSIRSMTVPFGRPFAPSQDRVTDDSSFAPPRCYRVLQTNVASPDPSHRLSLQRISFAPPEASLKETPRPLDGLQHGESSIRLQQVVPAVSQW
jgi:hypothetical protein